MTLRQHIERHEQELVAHLQGAIQIPSLYAQDGSGYPYGAQVHRCLEYMLSLARALGFSTHNLDDQVGWCEYGQGEEMVAILGHLDVVPEGEGWSLPPYGGTVKDGRIYGRGTMDDKGPTVAALYALLAIKEAGIPLKRRVRILFGLNEETGSADMKYYKSHGGELPVMGFTPDGEYPVINGEKGLVTQGFRCRYEQEGPLVLLSLQGGTAHNIVPHYAKAELRCDPSLARALTELAGEGITCTPTPEGFRAEAQGVAAHGGSPEEGVNAIGRLMAFLSRLPLSQGPARAVRLLGEQIALEWDGRSLGIATRDHVSGPLTFNLGTLEGDEGGFAVKLNYRYPVTRTFDCCGPQVLAAFQAAGFEETSLVHKEALYLPPESELVKKLLAVYEKCTGRPAAPKSIGGGTYAKMLPNVVAFGPVFPGDEVREHKADEFMEISRLIDNAEIIAEAILALAGAER